jgi:hypothetical protein
VPGSARGGAAVAGLPNRAAGSYCRNGPEAERRQVAWPDRRCHPYERQGHESFEDRFRVPTPRAALPSPRAKANKLVSTEVYYLRRILGDRATQQQIDEKVLQVRKLPWSEIVHD